MVPRHRRLRGARESENKHLRPWRGAIAFFLASVACSSCCSRPHHCAVRHPALPLPCCILPAGLACGRRQPAAETAGRLAHRARERSRAERELERSVGEVNFLLADAAVMPGEDSVHGGFAAYKRSLLNRTLVNDKSPKGCVDERVVELVREVNRHEEFATAQSCSGRVYLMAYESPHGARAPWEVLPGANMHSTRMKESHDCIEDAERYFSCETEPLRSHCREGVHLWLKMEPFDLDVDCASESGAKRLLAIAKTVVSRSATVMSVSEGSMRDKWRINVRGNQCLEMPFAFAGQCAFTGQADALANIVNAKLKKNWAATDRFLQALRSRL